jgi:hypothetical protein
LADSASSIYVKLSLSGIETGFKQYDAITISGCSVQALNGSKIIQTIGSGFIIVTAAKIASTSQSSGLKIDRNIPSMDFVTESANRVWGCSPGNSPIS